MSGQVQLTFEQKQQLCKLKKNNAKLTHTVGQWGSAAPDRR